MFEFSANEGKRPAWRRVVEAARAIGVRGRRARAAAAAAVAALGVATFLGATPAALSVPGRADVSAATIARGANLAAIGNCAGCHTVAGGAPYAGGLPLPTPFGKIYGSNITPDRAHGIGTWSAADFARAMQTGIAADGRHLYPAFPYDHFTRASADDLAALHAFLMTRTPDGAVTPPNELHFPFGFRPLVAGWNLLFLDRTPYRNDPARSAEWNRGAYLTESLAHCGACHTPRNWLGAEQRGSALAGGTAEGWYAPPLDADSPSPLPWSVDSLTRYLRTGLAEDHAIAGGPMQGVTASLARADEADVRAIAVYVMSQMGPPPPDRAAASRERAARPLLEAAPAPGDAQLALGATVYASACASCHDLGRGPTSNSALRLPLAVAAYDADPRSLLQIVRRGIVPTDGAAARWMPAFGTSLTDEQLTALAAYLRRAAADAPPWPELASAVRATRGADAQPPHREHR